MVPRIIIALLFSAGFAVAQVNLRWTVDQGSTETGWLWEDLNGDGLAELIKEDGLGTSFLDGDNDYASLWTVVDPEPEDDSWFSLAHREGSLVVFTRVNSTSQTSQILVYNLYGSQPLWTSTTLAGVLYRVSLGEFSGSGNTEVAAAWNRLDTVYLSAFGSWRLSNGAVTHAPVEAIGYLAGPWGGAVENASEDLLFCNRYLSDGSAILECYGPANSAVGDPGPARPERMELAVRPNPFNPSCRIRLTAVPRTPISVRVHDLRGALRRQWQLPAGYSGELLWDGRDQQGRALASGVYVVDIPGGQQLVTLRK